MLAQLVALHLIAFAQLEADASEPQSFEDAAPPQESADQWTADEPTLKRTSAVRDPAPSGSRQLSLLSAEPLEGGSMVMGWAGWSSIAAQWGMGVTSVDDLGLAFEYDWAGTELLLGGWYRRPLGPAGAFDMAGRIGVSWYSDYGAHYIHEDNHDDRGVAFEPGLVLSMRAAGGIISAIGELPFTFTLHGDDGLLFEPRVSLAYETPVYPDLNVGVIGGIGYRVGSNDAPMADGRVDGRFLLVLGYQLL